MIEIPADLSAGLVPLAWLVGTWEGSGVVDYHADGHHFTGEFAHRVTFEPDDGALRYTAHARMADDAGGAVLPTEVGFWRVARPRGDADAGPGLLPPRAAAGTLTAEDVERWRRDDDGFDLEVGIVRDDGVNELYLGRVHGPRIDLATDAVVRTSTAAAYSAATRMYGLVDGHLLWAWDIAALAAPLASHASARLAKTA